MNVDKLRELQRRYRAAKGSEHAEEQRRRYYAEIRARWTNKNGKKIGGR